MESRLFYQAQRVPMIQNSGGSWLSSVPQVWLLTSILSPSLKMGTMGPSKLLASLQALEDQLICSSATMLFRYITGGWRKGLKETSWCSKKKMQNPASGTNQSQEEIAGKQLCRKGIEKRKPFLGCVQQNLNCIQKLQQAKFQLHKRKKRFTTQMVKHQNIFQRWCIVSNLGVIQSPKKPDLFYSFVNRKLD